MYIALEDMVLEQATTESSKTQKISLGGYCELGIQVGFEMPSQMPPIPLKAGCPLLCS